MAVSDAHTLDGSTQNHTLPEPGILKSFSCVLCSQRKVKCDRQPGGCANCTKVRIPCVYKSPPPPRRRKKGSRDVDTTARLRLYEDALRQLGVDPEEVVQQELAKGSGNQHVSEVNSFLRTETPSKHKNYHPSEIGVLVTEHGKSRYLENGIWTSLKSEFREPRELLGESSDESLSEIEGVTPESRLTDAPNLIFGFPMSPVSSLRSRHPNPVQIFKLWQLYLDNINPLTKLFHAPTVQQVILDASGNLDDIPRNVEALLFAIYCITTESLSNTDCMSLLGESKSVVSQRFRSGAQHALVNSSLLKTTDLMVLQAFVLFVVGSYVEF
jgi:hypothetical protein